MNFYWELKLMIFLKGIGFDPSVYVVLGIYVFWNWISVIIIGFRVVELASGYLL